MIVVILFSFALFLSGLLVFSFFSRLAEGIVDKQKTSFDFEFVLLIICTSLWTIIFNHFIV